MAWILIAEDDAIVREILTNALSTAGHAVSGAANGREAVSLIRTTALDMVITDLWMPEMNGVDLIKWLRHERPALKVIAISGGSAAYPIEFSAALAVTWGADAVLPKPLDYPTLVERVKALLDPESTATAAAARRP